MNIMKFETIVKCENLKPYNKIMNILKWFWSILIFIFFKNDTEQSLILMTFFKKEKKKR